jgi:hypothetical protein
MASTAAIETLGGTTIIADAAAAVKVPEAIITATTQTSTAVRAAKAIAASVLLHQRI